jgi:zinc transport system ATP-binding protein
MSCIVTINDLDFSFDEAPVLGRINLEVERGSTLGLIGPNGGGKTTLIRLMLGLLTPSAGRILIDGLEPKHAIRRGDLIGYLPQSPRVPPNFPLNVRQMVRLGLAGKTRLFHGYRKEDLAYCDEMIERVGLADQSGKPIGALSGGQLQRAMIARALAPKPKLLLLDEPTVGIDRAGQQRFVDFLQQLKSALGLTVVLVSHDLRAVTSISDRIACLNVTLHYHDAPQHLPADLVYRMFACDLEAMGVGPHVCGSGCSHEGLNDQVPMTNKIPVTNVQ